MRVDRRAVDADDLAVVEPSQQLRFPDVGEAVCDEGRDGRPRTVVGDPESGGTDAVLDWQGSGHRHRSIVALVGGRAAGVSGDGAK